MASYIDHGVCPVETLDRDCIVVLRRSERTIIGAYLYGDLAQASELQVREHPDADGLGIEVYHAGEWHPRRLEVWLVHQAGMSAWQAVEAAGLDEAALLP